MWLPDFFNMKMSFKKGSFIPHIYVRIIAAIALTSCSQGNSSNQEMIDVLKTINKSEYNPKNRYCSVAIIAVCDSIISTSTSQQEIKNAKFIKANQLLQEGKEPEAIQLYKSLLKKADLDQLPKLKKGLAIAFLRSGERANCVHNHSGESCIFPIAANGFHRDKSLF